MVVSRTLPDHWKQPMFDYLFPLLDRGIEIHRKKFQDDKEVVFKQHIMLPEYQNSDSNLVRR